MAKHLWEKGQSANPNGRPPKNRALTTILERTGGKTVSLEGKNISRKRLVAELAWQIVTMGQATFPNGQVLQLEAKDWFDTVKWIYGHIDGPAKNEVQLSGDPDNPIEMRVTIARDTRKNDTSTQ